MRACIACLYFNLSLGDRGYSDLTPGWPGSISCQKGVFRLDEGDYVQPAKDSVEYARACPHFQFSQEALDAGWADPNA